MSQTLAEVGRNEFDEWCWRRGLDLKDVVAGLAQASVRLAQDDGKDRCVPSIETVRRIRLPFSDPNRRVPAAELVELIHAYTDGAVIAAHFYPQNVRGTPALAAPEARP